MTSSSRSKNELTAKDFKEGIYVCKGSHANMWWWLNHLGLKPRVMHCGNEDLNSQCFGSSIFEEETECIVIFPVGKLTIPKLVPTGRIVFVVLSEYCGDFSHSSYAKTYKSADGVVKAVDWNQVRFWKDKLYETDSSYGPYIQRYNSPSMVSYARSIESGLELDTTEISSHQVKDLVEILGKPESLFRYSTLTRHEIFSIFLTPDRNRCGLYTLLVKGMGREFGLCPELWFYFDMFCQKYEEEHDPSKLLTLFAVWMYNTQTIWSNSQFRGLVIYTNRKGKRVYKFSPSLESTKHL